MKMVTALWITHAQVNAGRRRALREILRRVKGSALAHAAGLHSSMLTLLKSDKCAFTDRQWDRIIAALNGMGLQVGDARILRPRKERTGTRFPGICQDAKALGVNRSTLFRALRGDVPLPGLRRRYQLLREKRERVPS